MPPIHSNFTNSVSRFLFRSRLGYLGLVLFVAASALTLRIPGSIELAQAPLKKDPQQQQPDTQRKLELGNAKTAAPATTARPNVPAFKTETQAYALIIGISNYPNLPTSKRLAYADADARELREFLISDQGGFIEENVTLLLNEQATRNDILSGLSTLKNKTGQDSIALVFFAGHGVVDKSGQAFLVPADVTAEELDSGNLLSHGIEMTTFNATIQSLRSHSTVVITDACHSGMLNDLLRNAGSTTGSISNPFAVPPLREQSSFLFAASSPTQTSIERPKLQHGLFSFHMLKGLKGEADADRDGLVTSKELYDYVARKIREDNEGAKQIPEPNRAYDRTIPLAILTDEARQRYVRWFKEDSIVNSLAAAFDDSLKENRLTKPEGDNAWDYLRTLEQYVGARASIKEKQDAFLNRVKEQADRLIEQSPNDASSWSDAHDYLDKARQLNPSDEEFKARLAFADVMYYDASVDERRAEKEADDALNHIESGHVSSPMLARRLGQFFIRKTKWNQAKRAYGLVIDKNPKPDWLTEYAEVLSRLKEFAEAEKRLRQALGIAPKHVPALKALAEILLGDSRFSEAKEFASRAREVAPDDLDVAEQLGRASLGLREYGPAIDSLVDVAGKRAAGDQRNRTLLYLSKAFSQSGDLERAISALREASGSQNLEIYDELAARLNELGAIDEALDVARKDLDLAKGDDRFKRQRLLAEYLERSGQLAEAARKYSEANKSIASSDAKLGADLENHAQALLLRTGNYSEANIVVKAVSGRERDALSRGSNLIIPGGLEALERLTGISIDAGDAVSLARVLEVCLQDPTTLHNVETFYNLYPELAKKSGVRGANLSGTFDLPAATQASSSDSREAIKFFGGNDKNGHRETKDSSRLFILKALGGDVEKFQRGEATTIRLRDEELPMLRGVETWLPIIKEGVKAKPEQRLDAFLKDQPAAKIYVAFSNFPDEAIRRFDVDVRANVLKDRPETAASLYFAAPYLRFSHEGNLEIPGGTPGERNWKAALKINQNLSLSRALFQKENGGALYLFCALSSAGKVGDFISSSSSFEQIYRLVEKGSLPAHREPFDLIDFFRLLRLEKDGPHLPHVGEVWMKGAGIGDPLSTLLTKIGRIPPGQSIQLVKQLAILTQLERERSDWTSRPETIDLIVKQIAANREPELEVALDLQMSAAQLRSFFSLIEKLDAQPATMKADVVRAFESAFELLRLAAKRNDLLSDSRIIELTDKLLNLDPASTEYGPALLYFLKSDLLRLDPQTSGAQLASKLIELLTAARPMELPLPSLNDAAKKADRAVVNRFDEAAAKQNQIGGFLDSQKCTKLEAVVDAFNALEYLRKNPAANEELARFKTAVKTFVEPERPPEPKKKPKHPVPSEPTFKESVAALASVSTTALNDLRGRLAPFISEALLAYVYAASADWSRQTSLNSDFVRSHNFATTPFSATRVDVQGKLTGSTARLAVALALLASKRSSDAGLRTAMLASSQLVNRRWVTRRAEEYVARTIDLGEEVLARTVLSEPAAKSALDEIDRMMPPRRADDIRVLVQLGDIFKALQKMAPSELYALGQSYFNRRLSAQSASLTEEAGSLGALARIAVAKAGDGVSDPLAREVRQFGFLTTSRTGLSRLDLLEPEPYEQSLSFRDEDRLAQRVQDVRLATIRIVHRRGGVAALPLCEAMTIDVLSLVFAQATKATDGTPPPARDWRSLVKPIQPPNELTFLMLGISKWPYVSAAPRGKWDDAPTARPTPGPKP